MKKRVILPFALTAVAAAGCLTGCGKDMTPQIPNPADVVPQIQKAIENVMENNPVAEGFRNIEKNIEHNIEKLLDEHFSVDPEMQVPPRSGVTRRLRAVEGYYTVEYVHTPYGEEKDESLDYKLKLNADNTYELSVVSDGVKSEHYGHWYERRDELMIFYDEPIDPPPHNVYTADRLYAEIISGGKIIVYDNMHTVVLSKATDDAAR